MVTTTNRQLHRICLTRRHAGKQDAVETASTAAEEDNLQKTVVPTHHFGYDVVTRPSNKDFVISRTKWHQIQQHREYQCSAGFVSDTPAGPRTLHGHPATRSHGISPCTHLHQCFNVLFSLKIRHSLSLSLFFFQISELSKDELLTLCTNQKQQVTKPFYMTAIFIFCF